MIREYLHLKQAFRVIVVFLLAVVGITKVNAQYYNYEPIIGQYTEEGSTSESILFNKFDWSDCDFLSQTVYYHKGHVNTSLTYHNTSSGLMRFSVAKCDGNYYFANNSSGKIIIMANNSEIVLCANYSISGTNVHEVQKSFYYDTNFTGTHYFDVFLVTSNYTNAYYAGRVNVRRANKPTVETDGIWDLATTSATLGGSVIPQGLDTYCYFQWGTTTSLGNTTQERYLGNGYSTCGFGASIEGLQPGTTYYFRARAYNDAGTSNGSILSFTTEEDTSAPGVTTIDADQIGPYSARLNAEINPHGLTTEAWIEYGTTTSLGYSTSHSVLDACYSVFHPGYVVYDLQPNTKYYFRAYASNAKGLSQGSRLYFYTDAGGNPVVTTGNASSVGTTTATLNGSVNPQGLVTNYYFLYGTTTNYELGHTLEGTLSAATSSQTVSANLSGLVPNTTYHYKLYASNNYGSQTGSDKTFKTGADDCYYPDCPSGELTTASRYLCERGIIQGINGNLEPNTDITRAQLAKTAFFGLYSNSNGVSIPNPLVTDYFPCIYPDLQENSYYYQAAKALLYLEYGDGRSPFDRNRSCFDPTGTISRIYVLKVLLETFNIAPATGGTNPFNDYDSSSPFWGYAKKAYDLQIVKVENLRPSDNCTRGEAFLFVYRILKKIDDNAIVKPNPNYDTYNPLNSDYFVPTDLAPAVANAIRGVEYGNFNYYQKDFFNIPGYMNLDFGIEYNSYLTEMPSDFYPVRPMGNAWTHKYDMYMNVISDNYNNKSYYVFHLQGGSLLVYGVENGNLKSLTEGNYYTISPTTPPNSSTTTYTLKSTGQISYVFSRKADGIYYLTQIKDRNNNTITVSYSSGGHHYKINSVSTLGRSLTFGYTSDTLLRYVKDPSNRYVYFYYDDDQMTSLKDAKNQTTYFNYGTLDSEKGLLKEIQLPKGNYVYNDYQRRKLKSMSYVGGGSQTHTDVAISPNYQTGVTTSTVTENLTGSQSVTTNYTMNDKNRITRMTDSNYTDVSYQYGIADNPDLVTKQTDNKTGLQTTYSYDTSTGMMTSVTFSNGSETHNINVSYNDYNDIVEYTDANNNKTHYYYSSSTHNLERITDALNHTTYIDNNSKGMPIRVTNPMGVSIEYGYNSYGNLNEITVPSMNLSATVEYDDVSRMTSKTDFANNTTSFSYDNNDNVTAITNADGKTTTYSYDANDNLVWVQNAKGKKTNFTYDSNTDFLTQVSFQGSTRSYTYNRDGSLKTFTDSKGHTFNYTYNNSGDLTSDGYASLEYNNKGQLWKISKDGMPITYTYDSFERVNSIAYDGKTVSYTYDNNGNVKTIVYPGNKTVTYTYDAMNRMISVKDWNNNTTSYNYRNDGQLNYYEYPNGVRTTYSYDASGRCNGITTKRGNGNGSVIAQYGFDSDNVGNHINETVIEPFANYPAIPSEIVSYSYNTANRLVSAGNLSFEYDANGNTTSRTGRTYGYDDKNNLTSVSGDLSASFTYDGLGNRRSATRKGTTTKYVLNLLGNMPMVLMETNSSGTPQNYYIYGSTGLLSRIDGNNNTRYYVYDYRGSTVAMTDASANITHKYQYDDFGKLLQSEEENKNLFRYVGQYGVMYEDDALTFMRARYYDPEIGRFLSEDPIWNTNLYPYAENNPIMSIDAKGEFVITTIIIGAAVMLGAGMSIYGIVDRMINEGQPMPDLIGNPDATARDYIDYANTFFLPVIPLGNTATAVVDVVSVGVAAENTVHTIKTRNQQKAATTTQATTPTPAPAPTAAPTFEVDHEAMDYIFSAADSNAKQLKKMFINIARSDLSAEKKYSAYRVLYREARKYMN